LTPYKIFNRKYIGSKRALCQEIIQKVLNTAGKPETFLDGFAGTGVISASLAENGVKKIYAVDTLYHNIVILKGFTTGPDQVKNIETDLDYFNNLPPTQGYITRQFAATYFTRKNCMRMDAVRSALEERFRTGTLNAARYNYLLASFLLGADRIANTVGQYDAYLKHIGKNSFVSGKHVIDNRVYSDFMLRPLELITAPGLSVYNMNILECIKTISCHTAYFDPPYNTRQYCDNYHVLENLARWEKPVLYGKTKKFDRNHLKSPFSQRRNAEKSLGTLLRHSRSQHIFLSYNSEGIIARNRLMELCSGYGTAGIWELPYSVFGKGAGVAKKRPVTEYLLHLQKEN